MGVELPLRATKQGIGASVRRNEDRRYLNGQGEYLADIEVPGMAEAVFLRSPVAPGKIKSIKVPEAGRGQGFFPPDIPFTRPILPPPPPKRFNPPNPPPPPSP